MIVLDTHALIWWASQDTQLSAAAKKVIEDELADGGTVVVSAISAWELAQLVDRGRIALAMDLDEWMRAVESIDGVWVVPLSAQTAIQSVNLPGEFHKDPADRKIVALARERNAVLVTGDEKIQRYPHVKWTW
ncbi:MAG: type II toxin-antitoxin system VapC family toxin [Proteobacteria bacterium]|nr:type II toxin-antitoxin system VapC family toxin [Pseudomonadota bacterium]